MKNIYTILSVIILSTFISCGGSVSENSNLKDGEETIAVEKEQIIVTQSQFDLAKMKLGRLSKQTFFEKIKTNGKIGVPPENKAAVSAYFGGYVKNISLLEGQEIKKGQLLFTLENPDYIESQKLFLEYKNKLSYLKSDYERQKELVKENVVSQKTFLKSESDYKVALVNYESLKKKLTLMNINPKNVNENNIKTTISIVSPISGFITKVNISKGMFLSPSNVAVTIISTEHLHIELNIYEQDLPKVEIGQNVTFKLQNNNVVYRAKIHLINKVINAESRQVNIHCHLINKNETNLFTPGMYVDAEILTKSKSSYALPENTIINIEDSYFVLELIKSENNNYIFEKREVQIRNTENGFIEVLNEDLILQSPTFLTEGAFNLINE